MTKDTQKPSGIAVRRALWAVRGLYGVFMLMGLLICFALLTALLGEAWLQFIMHAVVGWLFHMSKVLPPLADKLTSLIFPLICTLALVLTAHYFIRWCLNQKKRPKNWSFQHTAMVILLVLLTCGAAIAMSGIAHQLAWLSRSQIIINQATKGPITMDAIRLKQLGHAAFQYHQEQGHYPVSIQELLKEGYVDNAELMMATNNRMELGEPFLFLAPKASKPAEDQILIASPYVHFKKNKGDVVVVLTVDLSTHLMNVDEFQRKLEQQMDSRP